MASVFVALKLSFLIIVINNMNQQAHPKDPLHGITLQQIVEALVAHYGWERLAEKININCFKSNPSIKSSLTFLRKQLWAREQVERLYVFMVTKQAKKGL